MDRRIQSSLLPDRLPEVPGIEMAATYLPAGAEVGGDWYDVIGLREGGLGIAMGDVVGRGATAASVVGRLRSGVRAHALEGLPPSEVMRRVNALATDTRRDMCTLIYLVYHPATGELQGTSAGHPPALLRRADGHVERWNAARSMPLGVVQDTPYRQDHTTLCAGEALVLFTDGLIERRGIPLGDSLDRLEALIPATGAADVVRTAILDGMLGGADHDDDVAVLVLTVAA